MRKECPHCGKEIPNAEPRKKNIVRRKNKGNELLKDIEKMLHIIFHVALPKLFTTAGMLFNNPGPTLNDAVTLPKNKLADPYAFFAGCFTIYYGLVHFYFLPKHSYIGVAAELNYAQLGALLICVSFLGWLVNRDTGLSFRKTCFVFMYVYGTTFLADIPLLWIESNFAGSMAEFSPLVLFLLSDLPAVLFICYMMFRFYQVRRMGMIRFAKAGVLCLGFYCCFMAYYVPGKSVDNKPGKEVPGKEILLCEEVDTEMLPLIAKGSGIGPQGMLIRLHNKILVCHYVSLK